MACSSPPAKNSGHHVTIDSVSAVCSHSLSFLSLLDVLLPELHAYSVVEESDLHVKESIEAAHSLILLLIKIVALSPLVFNHLQCFINISLLLIQINLKVILVLFNICLLHKSVFFHKFALEISKELIIYLFESIYLLVFVTKHNLISYNCNLGWLLIDFRLSILTSVVMIIDSSILCTND